MSHLVSIFVDKKTQPGEDTIFLLVYIWGGKKNYVGLFVCLLFWLPLLVTIFLVWGKASFCSPGQPEQIQECSFPQITEESDAVASSHSMP